LGDSPVDFKSAIRNPQLLERNMTVKVGILGAGYMGKTHGRILLGDPRVILSAVFDIDAQRKEEAARELECRAAESEEQLMDQVDAVYVTLPNTTHAAASARALERGKHVFCEKPFATSLEDAGKLLELCRSTMSVFAVGHNRRFAPAYMLVKEFLAGGRHEPTLAQFKMNRGELESPPWVENAAVTGGYLYETPIHLFDMARWLLGEVTDLTAAGAARTYAEPDNFSLLLRFESGLSLTFASCAHSTWAFPFERIEIYGRYFTVETAEMERVSITHGLNKAASVQDFHALKMEQKWGYAAIDANFISAVLGEEATAVTADDGYRSVELADRCYRALRSTPAEAQL